MKKEIIKIVLIASLAFNLAFIGMGIFRMTTSEKVDKQSVSSFAGQYELSEDQSVKLDEIVRNFRIKLSENKSDVLEQRIDIIELLGDPEFTTETLDEKLQALNYIENQLNSEFVSTLMEIGAVLDDGQWTKFLYNISKGWFFSGSDQQD